MTEQDFDSDAMHWYPDDQQPCQQWELPVGEQAQGAQAPMEEVAPKPHELPALIPIAATLRLRLVERAIFDHARQVVDRIFGHSGSD